MIHHLNKSLVEPVTRLHLEVLPESIFAQFGERFLRGYYDRVLRSSDLFCVVDLEEGGAVGFLSYTGASASAFRRQISREGLKLSCDLFRSLAENPLRLKAALRALQFLLWQKAALFPEISGEVVSFAVLPRYRRGLRRADSGDITYTVFFRKTGRSVALELAAAALEHLNSLGIERIKIMTPTERGVSNGFYEKLGCELRAQGRDILGGKINVYVGAIPSLLNRVKSLRTSAERAAP